MGKTRKAALQIAVIVETSAQCQSRKISRFPGHFQELSLTALENDVKCPLYRQFKD